MSSVSKKGRWAPSFATAVRLHAKHVFFPATELRSFSFGLDLWFAVPEKRSGGFGFQRQSLAHYMGPYLIQRVFHNYGIEGLLHPTPEPRILNAFLRPFPYVNFCIFDPSTYSEPGLH